MNKATDKQINFALVLLDKAGYDTRYMGSEYKRLGATMAQRKGLVEDWLAGMTKAEISRVIDQLKG